MIACKTDAQAVRTVLKHSRVVGLPGPRQCGKTIRAREFVAPGSRNYFDLESPASLARLSELVTALRDVFGTWGRIITARPATARNWPPPSLDELTVVYPGTSRYPFGQGVEAVPLVGLVVA